MKLNLVIDRIEGEKAILKSDDGDTIVWPKNKLPAGANEKNILTIVITEGDNKNEELAKHILNEILDA